MIEVTDVELTPNPHAKKFILSEQILNNETRHYSTKDSAENDPLAKAVLELDGVESVFYMYNFITIEKSKDTDWGKIQSAFMDFISKFDRSLIPPEQQQETESNSGEMLKQILDVLNTKVMPALANDGGGLEIIDFSKKTLTVRYQGACGSCPSATRGTLTAIEKLLQRDVDNEINVVSV
jgi:Fe-S cluster biogenesis protein NfuA